LSLSPSVRGLDGVLPRVSAGVRRQVAAASVTVHDEWPECGGTAHDKGQVAGESMRSRSLIVIVVFGVVGMVAFGLMTVFAVDSSKDLQDVAKFKTAVLDRFQERGVVGVAFRNIRIENGGRAIEVLLTMASQVQGSEALGLGALGQDAPIHAEIAELVADAFPRSTATLRLRYRRPSSWGCGTSEPFLDVDRRLADVRAAKAQRSAVARADETLAQRIGWRIIDAETVRPRLRFRIAAANGVVPTDIAAILDTAAEVLPRIVRLYGGDRMVIEAVRGLPTTTMAAGPKVQVEASPRGNVAHAEERKPESDERREVLDRAEYDWRGKRIPPRR
jgi:hypothetical protein